MNTSARGSRKKRGSGGAPGTFRPALPGDTFEVMRLFGIAARAVCAAPEHLEQVDLLLNLVSKKLVVPEATAAQECLRLWKLFARVAQVPKQALRVEAGKAFCRDLDALGQRLDLPPLAEWEELPDGIEDESAIDVDAPLTITDVITVATVRQQAQVLFRGAQQAPAYLAAETAHLVSALGNDERRLLFEHTVGTGLLGRSDVNLLIRFLVKGDDVRPSDTVLIEVLERLGRHLAK